MKFLNRLAKMAEVRPLSTAPTPVYLFAASIVAFLVINYFFCPRFVLWKSLDVPPAQTTPEVNRAVATLIQIQDPFKPIADPSNSVIRWRLLFPLLAHYLAIPKYVYLAIPHIGCLLTLGWIAKLTLERTYSRKLALIASILFGTTSWFFISAGWLAYFDSWYMLGLLLASFHPSRGVLVACCLLMPWIDERFVVALPLAMVVREIDFERPFQLTHRPFLYDLLTTVITIAPWIAFRIAMIYLQKDQSPIASSWGVPLEQEGMVLKVLDGWWNGLRCLWVYPILYCVFACSRGKTRSTILLLIVATITMVFNLRLAGDISRSVSNLIPFALLGFFESIRFPYDSPPFSKDAWKRLLYAIAALNLFLPANHVVTAFKTPVLNWAFEKYHYQNPPADVNAAHYDSLGLEAWKRDEKASAVQLFSWAIQLDPGFATGFLNRGMAYYNLKDFQAAERDIRRAIELDPKLYEAHYRLAQLLVKTGDVDAAVPVLQRLLSNPVTANLRMDAEKLFQAISGP